jgi:HSP20 family molecular chaperone IbpA
LRTFDRSGLWWDAFTSHADIEETDDAFVLEVELPGIDRKDASVEVRAGG